jgi:enoyl-CoA hydratase/3-hydroxyacyl-CoA dehydrogenase
MNLTGDAVMAQDAYDFGLVNQVVPDHELLDTAVAWARKLSAQAPLASQQIKTVSAKGDLDEGIEAEKQPSARCSRPRTPRRASPPSWASARPNWQGRRRPSDQRPPPLVNR